MLWWLILGVSLPELRNAERTGQYSLLLGVSEKVWLEESGMWLSGMSGRFALDVDRSYHISWRLRKKKNKRERKKFPSSWTWTFLLLLPLDFKIVAGLVLRLRIWISSPRILQHLGGQRMMPSVSLALVFQPFTQEHPLPTFQTACSRTSWPPGSHQPIVLMKEILHVYTIGSVCREFKYTANN